MLITIYICVGTGLDGRPVPVEQDTPRTPALLLVAGQLAEPFQARD